MSWGTNIYGASGANSTTSPISRLGLTCAHFTLKSTSADAPSPPSNFTRRRLLNDPTHGGAFVPEDPHRMLEHASPVKRRLATRKAADVSK
jgi:hypothetical protein